MYMCVIVCARVSVHLVLLFLCALLCNCAMQTFGSTECLQIGGAWRG